MSTPMPEPDDPTPIDPVGDPPIDGGDPQPAQTQPSAESRYDRRIS